MKSKYITIINAREHNLKGINLKIPRNSITVITGISGSGKSSLAFDTIYAEGNRRYVESLSSYAKQFIDILKKPDLESIEGLSPSIAINQKNVSQSPRSTVGTSTDIYDYLRLLYSKIGTPFCYSCGKEIVSKNVESIIEEYSKLETGKKLYILSPIIRGKKGEHSSVFTKLRSEGFTSVIVDGKTLELDNDILLEKNKIHDIDLIVDKIITDDKIKNRISNSINLALRLSNGLVKLIFDKNEAICISPKNYCHDCGISYQDIEPRMFSFNSPYGACPNCNGLGEVEFNDKKIICQVCDGSRLKKEALSIKINKMSIYDLASMDMYALKESLINLKTSGNQKIIADKIIKEILERIDFIINVGLGYIGLNRIMSSLSGGEAQRIRLATQL
jgi:excinuclease ABC subunit A